MRKEQVEAGERMYCHCGNAGAGTDERQKRKAPRAITANSAHFFSKLNFNPSIVMQLSLKHFLLQAQVLSLYRFAIRASRRELSLVCYGLSFRNLHDTH